jgi:hypothetical protein
LILNLDGWGMPKTGEGFGNVSGHQAVDFLGLIIPLHGKSTVLPPLPIARLFVVGTLGEIYSLLTFGFQITTCRIFIFSYHTYIFSCFIIHRRHLASGFYHHEKLYLVNYTHATFFVNVCATRGSICVSKCKHDLYFSL